MKFLFNGLVTPVLLVLVTIYFFASAVAQDIPRARDVVEPGLESTYLSPYMAEAALLPRARDYVEAVAAAPVRHLNSGAYIGEDESEWPTPAKANPPCKNCDCGCNEGQPCKCDKAEAVKPNAMPPESPSQSLTGTWEDKGGSFPPEEPCARYRAIPTWNYNWSRSCTTGH